MAGRSDIEAGKAYVRLYLKQDTFLSSLTKIGPMAAKAALAIGAAITGAMAAVTAAVVTATKSFIALGSQLQDMSQRTGVSAEILGELKYAAEQSGTSIEGLENGIRRMQRVINDAAEGGKEAADSLGMLGLAAADLTGLAADEQIKLIADRLAQIEDPTRKAAVAMEVFGRSGTELLPMLSAGAEGIQALQDRARELGIVLSNEDVAAAEELGDSFDDLWLSIQAIAVQVGAALAPALKEALAIVQDHVTAGVEWVKQNRQLIEQWAKQLIPAVEGATAAVRDFVTFAVNELPAVLALMEDVAKVFGFIKKISFVRLTKGGTPETEAESPESPAISTPSVSTGKSEWFGFGDDTGTPRIPSDIGMAPESEEDNALFDQMLKDSEAAMGIAASVMTGQEKFDAHMAHLDDLFAKGLIDGETFSRAFDDARKRFDVQMPEAEAPGTPGPGLTADKVPTWETEGFPDPESLRRTEVAGSFSAAGIAALGGGQSSLDKVARNTEDTAKAAKATDTKMGELIDKIDVLGLEGMA